MGVQLIRTQPSTLLVRAKGAAAAHRRRGELREAEVDIDNVTERQQGLEQERFLLAIAEENGAGRDAVHKVLHFMLTLLPLETVHVSVEVASRGSIFARQLLQGKGRSKDEMFRIEGPGQGQEAGLLQHSLRPMGVVLDVDDKQHL
jgi:hypothetical protein